MKSAHPAPSHRQDADVSAAAPLAGRHALITGGSRGIGWAVAQQLARLGADVTLVARDGTRLSDRRAELAAKAPGRVHAFAADVADEPSVHRVFAQAAQAAGPPLVLVNNAGSGKSEAFGRMTALHWQQMIDANLTSAFLCARAAIEPMRRAQWGRIVNIASTAGLKGYAYVAAYCAAKHGLVGLTRALAQEFAQSGITVNAVCPGYTDTDMAAEAVRNIAAKTGRGEADIRAELGRQNPLGRFIRPEEVAAMVAFLLKPEAAAITGQAIAIAGGETS